MDLQTLLRAYQPAYEARYGSCTTPDQWSALYAMLGCRTPQYGAMAVQCDECDWRGLQFHSCGHRSCPQCHHHSNILWGDRQSQKRLPVTYFMVTFTLPKVLRALARHHSRVVYAAMFQAAIETLRKFGRQDDHLQATLAATVVLHTHSRRLDYHPHLHLLVPGGGIHVRRREWRTVKGDYLFNHFNLATVFRAILLRKLNAAQLRIPVNPPEWVAHCECVGKGRQAIEYLSRYLYRGLLSDKQITNDSGTHVTFTYRESKTNIQKHRTLKGEDLIRLLLIHVLPKGFRRARDYGFLHGNAKRLLAILQIILKIALPETRQRKKAALRCPCCHAPARILAFIKPHDLARLKPG